MKEVWKGVEGYNDYQISNFGRVKSFKRNKERMLKPRQSGNGYMAVELFISGKGNNKYIHRLVAIAFLPNMENKPEVNHLNGQKDNNTLNNLEWSTGSENMIHAVVNGLCSPKGVKGSSHYKSKLNENEVEIIRELLTKSNLNQTEIAKKFNVSQATISDIKTNKSWK